MGVQKFKFDSRPMCNGEHRAFIKLDSICGGISRFLDIGARKDYFYIDWLYDEKCLLIEPDKKYADELVQYINVNNLSDKIVAKEGLHPSESLISIYDTGSMFPRKSLKEVEAALSSNIIFCPETRNLIKSGRYQDSSIKLNAPCISPSDLLIKYNFDPSYVKIDIEGGEFIIIEDLLKSSHPDFVQYEYGVTWFHAGAAHSAMFDLMPNYYHYILTPRKMLLLDAPLGQFFYANIIAS